MLRENYSATSVLGPQIKEDSLFSKRERSSCNETFSKISWGVSFRAFLNVTRAIELSCVDLDSSSILSLPNGIKYQVLQAYKIDPVPGFFDGCLKDRILDQGKIACSRTGFQITIKTHLCPVTGKGCRKTLKTFGIDNVFLPSPVPEKGIHRFQQLGQQIKT